MTMDRPEEDGARALQELSAVADGEADAVALASACAAWRADDGLRASWHVYHLIGDVMRSDELASDARRDLALVNAVRERMAREPVVLAPTVREAPPARPTQGKASWRTPAAVAAGFIAVAGALLATNGTLPTAGRPDTLAQSLAGPATGAADAVPTGAEPALLVADGQLVRDARLQRYLAAHKQFDGSSALGVPSGFLRAATTQAPFDR